MTVKRTTSLNVSYLLVISNFADARTLEELLLELSLGDFNLNGLVHLLGVAALVVGVVLDRRREEGVDEGRLSQSGFTSNLRIVRHVPFLDQEYHTP